MHTVVGDSCLYLKVRAAESVTWNNDGVLNDKSDLNKNFMDAPTFTLILRSSFFYKIA